MYDTLEQYVLAKIQEQERIIDELKNENELLQQSYDACQEKFVKFQDFMRKIAKIRQSMGSGETYVSFDSIWSTYNTDDYKEIIELLGLQEEEEL